MATESTKSAMLSPERLAEIRQQNDDTWEWVSGQRYPTDEQAAWALNSVTDLLAAHDALAQQVAEKDAIIGALKLVNAGHMDKATRAIKVLMEFPEYAEAEALLLKYATSRPMEPAAPACPGDCATCERKEVARG